MQKELEFKIATSFSGEYRDNYVRPICNELLKMGLSKKEIFFDEWHDAIINGPSADDSLRIIYKKTLLTVVFLSEEYLIKNWTYNVEWNSIRQHINNGENQRIFLLGTVPVIN